ncbi:MAG TPA: zinc-ribbon domain containing protein [Chthoniobacteraceae bacterium]|nr:zinc-ribbon domain containing protein [Chthoniobacteraceae bacterium]
MPSNKYKPEVPPVTRRIPKVVFHPRYGDEIVSTSCKATPTEVRASYRNARALEIFPESAIRADPRKQNHEYTDLQHFYADILLRCPKCRRKFIFFAREQQFWYEHLKIHVGVKARYCWECAEKNRIVKAAYARYQEFGSVAEPDNDRLLQHAEDLVVLYRAGRLKRFDRLGELKNQLIRRNIPEDQWNDLMTLIKG